MNVLANLAAISAVDLWALVAAVAASGLLALRSRMLRPDFRHLVDAPPLVWASLSMLSIVCAGYAVTITGGEHATAREALLLSGLAAEALAMFVNLRRQARPPKWPRPGASS